MPNLQSEIDEIRGDDGFDMMVPPHACGGGWCYSDPPILNIFHPFHGIPYLMGLSNILQLYSVVDDVIVGGTLSAVNVFRDTNIPVQVNVDCHIFVHGFIILLHHLGLALLYK